MSEYVSLRTSSPALIDDEFDMKRNEESNKRSVFPPECDACDRAYLCFGRDREERKSTLKRARAASSANDHATRLVLCSDSPILRNALAMLISTTSRYRVVVEIANCAHALRHIAELGADVALVDFDLTGNCPDRLATLKTMISAAPRLPALILTEEPDCDACRSAFQTGAKGIILKSKKREDLFGAIDRVARGETWLEGPALEKILAEKSAVKACCPEESRIALLTRREREIVRVVACGYSNRQVGQQLFISGATVRHHLCAIFEKLGVSTRGELIVYAYRHQLAEQPRAEGH